MSATIYQQLILNGIQSLPPEALAEIADFVYFIRQKILQPQNFQEEVYQSLVKTDLQVLNQTEAKHLEQEFANYEDLYPDESICNGYHGTGITS